MNDSARSDRKKRGILRETVEISSLVAGSIPAGRKNEHRLKFVPNEYRNESE